MYDENYYKTLNYADYLGRQERYDKLAQELSDLLSKLNLVSTGMSTNILDYGCAVGFLVSAFQRVGYMTHGYDISEWAVKNAVTFNVDNYYPNIKYDVVTCLDVFEHMQDHEIRKVLKEIETNVLIVRIPCSTDGGQSFHLDVSRRDPTHINCKSKAGWIELIGQSGGFESMFNLNLLTIYDSPGVFCAMFVK
jgi:cyclopropane fatty-acyl-phospholipid synthase-like methyltransferase